MIFDLKESVVYDKKVIKQEVDEKYIKDGAPSTNGTTVNLTKETVTDTEAIPF